jgi:Terpene cyclase DEP1
MRPKTVYLGLCVVGTVLPYSRFVPFLREHGLDLRELVAQLFANPVSGFFGMDVIVSSLVLWVFVAIEGRRLGLRRLWAPVAANLAVGVSLGLPLFLYMREARLEVPAGKEKASWT